MRDRCLRMSCLLGLMIWALLLFGCQTAVQDGSTDQAAALKLLHIAGKKPHNVVFILSDDHRFDAMSFMGHPFLETPNMDRLAAEGVHLANAFVTTSLCSPSRATILTGQYAHQHKVVNNQEAASDGLIYFPQYLQAAGYETAFIGKWHMGRAGDEPQRGFSHWVSFRGQGSYLPSSTLPLNVNGKQVEQEGYITDELTDYAVDWINRQSSEKPFFLYLSHKAVHSNFLPADRHKGRYADVDIQLPGTEAINAESFNSKPRWVKTQRNSTHGLEFADQKFIPLSEDYRSYCEAVLAVDDSVGRVMDALEEKGFLNSTAVIYMGDNGYQWGDQGLQDKRTAYEPSIRVPLLMRCPELFPAGARVDGMVLNLDIAPTILDLAGLQPPPQLAGKSFVELAKGQDKNWRNYFLYEYFWERNYPQTPTLHAIRTDRFKYVHYQGVWDVDELYDLEADPGETVNLIQNKEHQPTVKELNELLFDTLEETDGMSIPLYRDRGNPQMLRRQDGSRPGDFPDWIYVTPPKNSKN